MKERTVDLVPFTCTHTSIKRQKIQLCLQWSLDTSRLEYPKQCQYPSSLLSPFSAEVAFSLFAFALFAFALFGPAPPKEQDLRAVFYPSPFIQEAKHAL